MKLLIVDDESLVRETIRTLLDWRQLGFTDVFVAENAQRAMEIIKAHCIDIMLCDIEMPHTSGLELIDWTGKNSPQTQTVIITCHASFHYARDALRMGSSEYILKPVSADELEQAMRRVVLKADTRLSQGMRAQERERQAALEEYWCDFLLSPREMEDEEDEQEDDGLYTPFLVLIYDRQDAERFVKTRQEFQIKQTLYERLGKGCVVFSMERCKLAGVLPCTVPYSMVQSEEICARISACAQEECGVRGYVGHPTSKQQLPESIKQLKRTLDNDLMLINAAAAVPSLREETTADLMAIQEWRRLMSEEKTDEILSRVQAYLRSVQGLDRSKLVGIQADMEQQLGVLLQENGVYAHVFFMEEKTQRLRSICTDSPERMLEWMAYVLQRVRLLLHTIRSEKPTVVTQAIDYIHQHLGEELSRHAVASQVYLNPDYLDRIFKRVIGVSVNRYIFQERMNKARQLLESTEENITDIALTVGYNSISNFSMLFKKYIGLSPNEFRKRSRQRAQK